MAGAYNRQQFVAALREAGLRAGDVVFSHNNIGFFGLPEETRSADGVCALIADAFREVLGPEGTLVVPTFTYSFCKLEPFDVHNTPPSAMGVFAEWVWKNPDSIRSEEPIFSVAALGGQAAYFVQDPPEDCFGPNSFWDRFLRSEGIICNLNLDAGSTFLHYLEREERVPYRYDKAFPGVLVRNGQPTPARAVFFCQDASNPDTVAAFEPFDALAQELGIVCRVRVGRGSIVALRARDAKCVLREGLRRNPWFLTVAGRHGRVPQLTRPATKYFPARMPPNAAMSEIVSALSAYPRDLVSEGIDAAVETVASLLPVTMHEYPTGTRVGRRIVPERWTCVQGFIESPDGQRVLDYANEPACIASYSMSADKRLDLQALLPLLHTADAALDAIPFTNCLETRGWGVACSEMTRAGLQPGGYRVLIESRFSFGRMKVAEAVVRGELPDSILYCAHLDGLGCNDNLSAVAVAVDLFRELIGRACSRLTHRLLLVPGELGFAAYAGCQSETLESVRAVVFLEMLGGAHQIGLQCPAADHPLTHAIARALGEFEVLVEPPNPPRNHEWEFALDLDVPLLVLSRGAGDYPFPGFGTSADCRVSIPEMLQSRAALSRLVEAADQLTV
jgi:aminoglycoside 3-N-acetyltransferase